MYKSCSYTKRFSFTSAVSKALHPQGSLSPGEKCENCQNKITLLFHLFLYSFINKNTVSNIGL